MEVIQCVIVVAALVSSVVVVATRVVVFVGSVPLGSASGSDLVQCTAPVSIGLGRMLAACGQCLACRVTRRRHWTHRLMLESKKHTDMSFVTLTYDDEHLPFTDDELPTLDPRDTQLFLKMYRKYIAPVRVRYFLVGEYGDQTQRPHYHFAFFGAPPCEKGRTTRNVRSLYCCASCRRLEDAWQRGQVFQGELTTESIQYVASYTTKKMTMIDDSRLHGRYPEFARMSRRPGIGYDMLQEVAHTWIKHQLQRKMIDVPTALNHGGRLMPLDRYARTKLREMIGRDKNAPPQVKEMVEQELQALRDFAEAEEKTLAEVLAEQRRPREKQYEQRLRNRPKRKPL